MSGRVPVRLKSRNGKVSRRIRWINQQDLSLLDKDWTAVEWNDVGIPRVNVFFGHSGLRALGVRASRIVVA